MRVINRQATQMKVSELEAAPDELRAHWLTNRLQGNGHLPQGKVVSVGIKAVEKHHFALEVAYSSDASDSSPRNFILKWYHSEYPFGLGEGLFFDQIAPEMSDPPVPLCYDVRVGWDAGETHILLEDLSASHFVALPPYDCLSRETFEQVMDAYLEVHARWWDHPRIGQSDVLRDTGAGVAHEAISAKVIRRNEQHFSNEVLPTRIDQLREKFGGGWEELCERVIASWADMYVERIGRGTGLTLVHGDAQLGNVLLPRNPQLDRPVIIDWEGCIRGIGVWDLARTMIQTELPSNKRLEIEEVLLSRYQAALVERGIKDYSREACIADYRLSVLANIPHALVWEIDSYLESAMRAYRDWECEGLLR